MTSSRVIDVQAFIDSHPLSALQRVLLGLCFLVVAIDGFDTALVGFIAPAIRVEWQLAVTRLGPLFAAGLFGLMIGSFAVGPLADRYGRKAMLIGSVSCFGAGSLSRPSAPTSPSCPGCVSWALGIGRCGSVLGSFLGGAMLVQGWGLPRVYGLVAIPTAISGLALLTLGVLRARDAARITPAVH